MVVCKSIALSEVSTVLNFFICFLTVSTLTRVWDVGFDLVWLIKYYDCSVVSIILCDWLRHSIDLCRAEIPTHLMTNEAGCAFRRLTGLQVRVRTLAVCFDEKSGKQWMPSLISHGLN